MTAHYISLIRRRGYYFFTACFCDGQVGQRIVLRDTMGHDVPWGVRDGMDRYVGQRIVLIKGHHGMFLDVPYVPWGSGNGMDAELC